MATAWLCSWLTELSLSDYIEVFENSGYTTPEQCITIKDREVLKSIGVHKLGHLNRLYRAIEKLGCEMNGERGEGADTSTLPLSSGGVVSGERAAADGVQQSKSTTRSGEGKLCRVTRQVVRRLT